MKDKTIALRENEGIFIYHINYLKILAAFFALKTFAKSSKGDHVRLANDR